MKENIRMFSMNICRLFLVLFILFQTSCKTNNEFIGYIDLIENSPKLLWSSSSEELKNNYPNIEQNQNMGIIMDFKEIKIDGKVNYRSFNFINNQLFMVLVSYGNYSFEMLELFKDDIIKKYGKITIEDNGTIETWHIEKNKNNEIVIQINKIENNTVNCSYIFPSLRDEYLKIPIKEY